MRSVGGHVDGRAANRGRESNHPSDTWRRRSVGLHLDASSSPQPDLATIAPVSVSGTNVPLVVQPGPYVGGGRSSLLDPDDVKLGRNELLLEDDNFAHELCSGDLHTGIRLLTRPQGADVGRGDRMEPRPVARGRTSSVIRTPLGGGFEGLERRGRRLDVPLHGRRAGRRGSSHVGWPTSGRALRGMGLSSVERGRLGDHIRARQSRQLSLEAVASALRASRQPQVRPTSISMTPHVTGVRPSRRGHRTIHQSEPSAALRPSKSVRGAAPARRRHCQPRLCPQPGSLDQQTC